MTDIPTWAWKEVDVRVGYTHQPGTSREWAKYTDKLRGLAAGLIAQHEQPPVDPLLIEAREIVAKHYDEIDRHNLAEWYRKGKLDDMAVVRITLEALRRGAELGNAGAA